MPRLELPRSGEPVERATTPAWERDAPLQVVGQRFPRVEGVAKVTGSAEYTSDVRLPRQLYARVLRSPLPHARIRRIDTSRAEALNGVHAVASSANCSDVRWYGEQVGLFDTTLRFVGDEVAAVAAESEEIAEDALRLIDVEYEPLPFVPDLDAALRPDVPRVHPSRWYPSDPQAYSRGDLEAGAREADVVVERTYVTQTALHNALESHGATAMWEGDHLTLWDSTQGIWAVRAGVASALGIAQNKVRVIKQFMGGGFGAKQVAWKPTAIAAVLARQAGRPVQLMHDRRAENLAAGNRNATRQRVRMGARRDGKLTLIEAEIDLAQGAYLVGGETSMVDGPYQTLYRCPNVRTRLTAHYTNTGPAVAFRAPGYVEGGFGLESAMDELARALNMDPVELRLRNYAPDDQVDEKPYSSPDALRECIALAVDAFGWREYQRPHANGSKRRGRGFAAHNWIGGAGSPPGYAWIKLNTDGTADVVTATQDIGTGTRTGLTQIASEALSLPMERVRLHLGDTATGPYSPTSSGSATQATLGPAIRVAAAEVVSQLMEAAATLLEVQPSDLRLRDGEISVEGAPGKSVSIADIAEKLAPHTLQGFGSRAPNPSDYAVRTFGAQCAEVEVDVETGEVRVLRVVASHDCGRIVNPTMVDSQVIGAVTMGLGFGLLEECIVDTRTGIVLNADMEQYELPTVADIPRIEHAAHDVADVVANPTGAKGIGEPPLIPTAPAIANAIFDAVGVRVYELPITRQRLLDALGSSA